MTLTFAPNPSLCLSRGTTPRSSSFRATRAQGVQAPRRLRSVTLCSRGENGDKLFCSDRKNLVLVGGRGCGKSSIARRMMATDKRFILLPLDELITYEAAGKSIPEIVQERGWTGFRDIEFQVVEKASKLPAFGLVDCGGGVVVDVNTETGEEVFSQRKVNALRQSGLVVYIQRDVEYLLSRIKGDSNRPDLSATISFTDIMERREPWYIEAADLVVDAKDKSKAQISREILTWYYDNIGEEPASSKWYSVWTDPKLKSVDFK